MFRGVIFSLVGLATLTGSALADPLSRRTEIDFFRDVPSRNLKGFAARSDGRLVAGPVLTELSGAAPADLLWCLEPTNDDNQWLIGTGPDGKILEVTLDPAKSTFSARELAKLEDPHVFALARLPDGAVLAGTSPKGALSLVRDGKVVARVALPVDSIFDLLVLPATETKGSTRSSPMVLVATGNPGRIYRLDVAAFTAAGVVADKINDPKALADHGLTLLGEIRDRNVRRLARMSDGRIVAGSSPRGNVYLFSRDGGPPELLQENRDGEVTDLLPSPDGGLFATITFSGGTGETRITPAKGGREPPDASTPPPFAVERFSGRSALVWFPKDGFPETLSGRANAAFYRVARQGDVLLITGGEQGEILGFDLQQRLALTYAGSVSSQLNDLAPLRTAPGRFLILRNNAPGFALLDFSAKAPREAETRRIDLAAPSLLGAMRFNRLRDVTGSQVSVELKTSNGSDEIEGWGPWVPLTENNGGWSKPDLRGRYVKVRVRLPADAPAESEIDKGGLYHLPQNRRPQLQEFHLLTSNFSLVPAPEIPPPPVASVGQLVQGGKDDDNKRKNAFLSSQIVPSPGTQVVLWTVTDPDSDNVVCTFSLRRDGQSDWTDVAVNTREPYAQFDISHLADGLYFTRLVATESDPRPLADRLSVTFETDDLLVDHTAPEILEATARRDRDKLVVTVRGRDALSLVDGFEAVFNNGVREPTEQPLDGIRDGREETFRLEIPLDRVATATAVEVSLYDAAGNASTKRLTW